MDLFLLKTNGIPRTTRFWSKETNILKEKCSEMHFILYYILEHPFPFLWPVLILGSICTCSKLVFFLKPVCLYLLTYFGWGNWGISLERTEVLSGDTNRVNTRHGNKKRDQIQLCSGSCFEEVAVPEFSSSLFMALDKSFDNWGSSS